MKSFYALLFTFTLFVLNAQDGVIHLINPSFEDMPRHSKPPRGWYDCGFRGESPPDVQPNAGFKVTKPALDGNTYLAMITREKNTWERVNQQLSTPLKKQQAYEFSVYLARSESYISSRRVSIDGHLIHHGETIQDAIRRLSQPKNFNTPIVLKIWGGNNYCEKKQLLAQSPPVENLNWKDFTFHFMPKEDYTYLILEAFYAQTYESPYNGNILIDHASSIKPIDKINSKYITVDTNLQVVDEGEDRINNETQFISEGTPIKEIEFSYPTTKEGLSDLIRNNGIYIRFDRGEIQQHEYKTTKGGSFINNPYSHIIAEALTKHPNVILIIVVDGQKERVVNTMKTFVDQGCPLEQLIIREMRPGDRSNEWLWSSYDTPLLMRLVFK